MVPFKKPKQKIKSYPLSWVICFVSFIGIMSTVTVCFIISGNEQNYIGVSVLKFIFVIFAVMFFISYIFRYKAYRLGIRTIKEIADNISKAEGDISAAIANKSLNEINYDAISHAVGTSIEELNLKNAELMLEIERNERLTETISEFYRQMKTLKDADLKIDFFEYEIENSVFFFMDSNTISSSKGEELTVINGEDFFNQNNFSIGYNEFLKKVGDSIKNDSPIEFISSMSDTSQDIKWIKFWGRPSSDKTSITGLLIDITRDIHDKEIEKERAIRDTVTGFYNRNALSEIAGEALAQCRENEYVVFIYIGLVGYTDFLEQYGMVAANKYIQSCSKVLRKFLAKRNVIFRWWGSDFLLLAKGVRNLKALKKCAFTFINKAEQNIVDVEGIKVNVSLTIGYAASKIHGEVPEKLVEYASFAQHEALKDRQLNPNEFNKDRYEESKRATLRRSFIKDIIEQNQLEIVFQPIVSLRTGELFGFEALSRPKSPLYRSISELIDDAELSGNYPVLEKKMIYNALNAYKGRDKKFKDKYLFINTAPYYTLDEEDYEDMKEHYFGNMKVVFEVVERSRIDIEHINTRRSIVSKAGAKFALDDFGSGYSNYLALLALEPDIIKIDRELITNIDNDLRKQHMLENIIGYARYRGTRILAEGVETRHELETLCKMGIDYAQGYFTGKPTPVLAEPEVEAVEIIKSISRSKQINFYQCFTLTKRVLELFSPAAAEKSMISAYLIMKLGKMLNYKPAELTDFVITALFHDIGLLHTQSSEVMDKNEDEFKHIPDHCIFGYALIKEFFPYTKYAAAILYHHTKFTPNYFEFANIPVTNEAYLLSLVDTVADMILKSEGNDLYDILDNLTNQGDFKKQHISCLKTLFNNGIAESIKSKGYVNELKEHFSALHVRIYELENIVRTLVYSGIFKSQYGFCHVTAMETLVTLFSKMTRQTWYMMEKARIVSILYSLNMLVANPLILEEIRHPEEEHKASKEAIKKICPILEEAELFDTMDIFNYIACGMNNNGNGKFDDFNRMLMGKDIMNGSAILIFSDIFSTLVEKSKKRSALSCHQALQEIKQSYKNYSFTLAMIEMAEDHIEDIEARINMSRTNMLKHYENVKKKIKSMKRIISGYS